MKKNTKLKIASLNKFDRFLLNYAKLVDDIDMYTGPFFEAKIFTTNETFHTAANLMRITEYSLKIPFIMLYIGRTKDYSALHEWIPKEIFALNVPYGGLLQIFRRYERTCKSYYGLK